jgi:uncharacterized protein DUF6438
MHGQSKESAGLREREGIMEGKDAITRLRLIALLLCLVSALTLIGCGTGSQGVEGQAATPQPVEAIATPTTSPPGPEEPVATPTVDTMQARATFEAGGELTYQEVAAIRPEMDGYRKRQEAFVAQLEKCTLKETYGWVASWSQEYDKDYKVIPDRYRLAVYLDNPYYGFGKELRGYPEMLLVYFTKEELAQFKYGQRIRFTGSLTILDDQISVKDPKFTQLEDEPVVPEPSAEELKDLHVVLDRTMCFGSCPAYTLTIEASGKVTFEGRYHTKVTGTVNSMIDNAKLTELATEIKKADFFSLDDSYSRDVTDNPYYRLSVTMNGQSKQVMSYATRPRRLEILMDRVDQIVGADQWIRSEENP